MDNSRRLVNVYNNLTISGTLQSFQTSLLVTSSSVMDGKIGTIIGVSVPNVNAKIDAVIGVSIPQFLTKNETIIPSSFIAWGNDYTTDKYIKNPGNSL